MGLFGKRVAALAVMAVFVTGGCGSGQQSGFCATHTCISSFASGHGYIVQCNDGMWSHSGGVQGACSGHGGES